MILFKDKLETGETARRREREGGEVSEGELFYKPREKR